MRSRRVDRMCSSIRLLVSEAIATKLNDPRISPFASVTRVEISGDLQVAKVYVSVMGSPAEERRTLEALSHAAGHIQRLVGKELSVRHVPGIRFLLDESIRGAAATVRIIDDTMKDLAEPAGGRDPADGRCPAGGSDGDPA